VSPVTQAAVVGVGAVSPLGLGWRQLAEMGQGAPATLLPGVQGFQVAELPPASDAGDAKSRRLMSRAARFAAICAREALAEAGWTAREQVGYWLGVGASGGPLEEIVAMIGASLDDGRVSMARLGEAGLAVSNPLSTFQVLNNFTMCHGAIALGTGGPNGAFFSRGAGTVHALDEAVWALRTGDCTQALAGGADTALHPVTWSELARQGLTGLAPGEGGAVLALEARERATAPLAVVESVELGGAVGDGVELVIVAPAGDEARRELIALAGARPVVDVSRCFGEALAGGPALAWATAVARLAAGRTRRVAVLSLGTDGDLGVVHLGAP
jgi:hypothetical protein